MAGVVWVVGSAAVLEVSGAGKVVGRLSLVFEKVWSLVELK